MFKYTVITLKFKVVIFKISNQIQFENLISSVNFLIVYFLKFDFFKFKFQKVFLEFLSITNGKKCFNNLIKADC
jgi:hypothetical protein